MIYVYRLPEEHELSDGFCPPAGKPITFHNVDWFNTPDEFGGEPMSQNEITEFLTNKVYYAPQCAYFVFDTADYTRSFIIPVDD